MSLNPQTGQKEGYQDPSAAIFASMAGARYMVVRSTADQTGKRFSTLVAAQDYARRSGGIIRQV